MNKEYDILKQYKKHPAQMPLPEGYMESLNAEIREKLQLPDTSKELRNIVSREKRIFLVRRMSIAASFVMLFSFATIWFMRSSNDLIADADNNGNQEISAITSNLILVDNEDIYAYIME